jgi:hypothetical protein
VTDHGKTGDSGACPICGISFEQYDRIRQPEYEGFRVVGKGGLTLCSIYCWERWRDRQESETTP